MTQNEEKKPAKTKPPPPRREQKRFAKRIQRKKFAVYELEVVTTFVVEFNLHSLSILKSQFSWRIPHYPYS
jgi:hypothetical protein